MCSPQLLEFDLHGEYKVQEDHVVFLKGKLQLNKLNTQCIALNDLKVYDEAGYKVGQMFYF